MPLQMPSDEFRLLKGLVEKIGEPYIGGVLLQVTHASAVVLCSACGPVEPRFSHGWPTDWFALCQEVLAHVKENQDHEVVVRLENSAIYAGPSGG